jgi:hypothetical protein
MIDNEQSPATSPETSFVACGARATAISFALVCGLNT